MIGEKTRNTIRDAVGALLNMYQNELDKAYLKAEKSLTLSISVSMKPGDQGEGVAVDTSLTFVTDRVKEKLSTTVNETWEELPGISAVK